MADNRTWYHIILTVYGAWLYGDSRGFRTRHHREHVEGDYQNPPPPGMYVHLERRRREALKQDVVVLSWALREVVGRAMLEKLEKLEKLGGLTVAVAVGGQHVHLLSKLPTGQARRLAGLAKKHAWFVLRNEHGWKEKLWGKRGRAITIRDRGHQLNTYRYILDHEKEGAWTWGWARDRGK